MTKTEICEETEGLNLAKSLIGNPFSINDLECQTRKTVSVRFKVA